MNEIEYRADQNRLEIRQGVTFRDHYTLYSDDGETLIDLTGKTARISLCRDNNTTPITQLTTENSRIALGGAAGTVTLTISATDTAALPHGNGIYSFELIDGDEVSEEFSGIYIVERRKCLTPAQ